MNIKKILIISILLILIATSEFYFFYPNFIPEYKILLFAKSILKSGFYTLSYGFSILGLALIPFIKNRALFLSALLLVLVTYFTAITYTLINHHGFGLTELQVLIHEANKFSSDAINSFKPFIIKSAIFTLAIFITVLVFRYFISKNKLFISTRSISLTLLVGFCLSLIVIFKTVSSNIPFPEPINILGTIVYSFSNAPYFGPRDKLTESPAKPALYKNIIWMIDESIGGKYLSINGYDKETTPFLASIKDRYINLGIASSTGNCSAESNISLMSGIQLNQLPDNEFKALKKANIFQYAQKAGYKTHYISGQSHDKLLQNYMTEYDLKYIDDFYQPPLFLPNKVTPEKDIIDHLSKILKEDGKNFIYVVKRGAHFHWEKRYPKSKRVYKPTLLPTDGLSLENKEKALNSYANAVKFTVDDFFKAFYTSSNYEKDKSSIIIYTSDHGQSIIEGNSFGTHCDGYDPNKTQGIVPLMIFTNTHKELFTNSQKDKYSTFQIFPTTLELMGYSELGGKSILHETPSDQRFFSGDLFGRSHSQKNLIK